MDLLLCAYSFAISGNNPEWVFDKTTLEKKFLLASISWYGDKQKGDN